MKTNTTDKFIEILSDERMELFNGTEATNRITAPIGTNLAIWVERIIAPPKTLEELLFEEQYLLDTIIDTQIIDETVIMLAKENRLVEVQRLIKELS